MPPSSGDFARRIKGILKSVQPLPDEAKAPILHYRRTVAEIWGSLAYVERLISERERYQGVVDRHLGRLYGMALVNLIETFERFLKEAASECVDALAEFIVDDRFNAFALQGASLATHFGAGSAGKALCETATWLDCKEINDRFRKLLADPFEVGAFYVFPKTGNQEPTAGQWRYDLLSLVWQIRHTAVHNVGVITKSDAVKPSVMKSRGGATLTRQSDDSVLASGINPDRDDYSLVARTDLEQITAIRLEALPDPSLPRGGPGRFPDNGNYHFHQLQVFSGGQPCPLANIVVLFDESQEIRNVVGGKSAAVRGWGNHPRSGQANTAIIATRLQRAPEDDLTIEMHFSRAQWP